MNPTIQREIEVSRHVKRRWAKAYNAAPQIRLDAKQSGQYFFEYLLKADFGLKNGDVRSARVQDGRRVLIIKTPFDNVLIFDGYPGAEDGARPDAHCLHIAVPDEIRRLFDGVVPLPDGAMWDAALDYLLGCPETNTPNIGRQLEAIRRNVPGARR